MRTYLVLRLLQHIANTPKVIILGECPNSWLKISTNFRPSSMSPLLARRPISWKKFDVFITHFLSGKTKSSSLEIIGLALKSWTIEMVYNTLEWIIRYVPKGGGG